MRLISNLKRAKYIGAALILMLAAMPVSPIAAWIQSSDSVSAVELEVTEVHDGTELYNAMLAGGSIKLANDIDAWYWMYVYNDTTLDLNGYTINIVNTYSYDPYLWVYNGATLTIEGNGAIEKNYASNDPAVWASDGGKVVLENGVISAVNRAVAVSYTDGDAGAEFEMNGGSVVSENDFAIVGWKNAKVTINGGAISAKYSCISGNGNSGDGGAEFYINGGSLTSEGTAIYAPQYDGVVEMTGGAIVAGKTGIEIRSGNLEISGGTITSNATTYTVNPNGSGTTTTGAAVAVSQHTTRQPINVTISGGSFTGPVAFSQADPQDGDAVNEVITISGGTFISNNDNYDAVEASDPALLTVSGGTFSDPKVLPAELADGKVLYASGSNYVVGDAPDTSAVPARVLVEAGVETAIDGLDAVQDYTEFSANNGTTFVKPNKITTTDQAGLSNAKISFNIYNSDGTRNTSYDKTIKVHAYVANDIGAIPIAKGSMKDDLALEFAAHSTYDTLEVRSANEDIATITANGDGTYTVDAIENGDVEIQGRVIINSAEQEATDWLTLGTVRVYTFNVVEEVTIPVSTTALDVNGGVIANIENPGAIAVELEGDAATLEGTTADTAKITATAAGDATLIYKAGEVEIGRTTVHVYVLPTLTDMLIQSWDSVGDLATSATFPKLEGENLPTYSLDTDNAQLITIEDGENDTKIVRTKRRFQHSGNATVTVHYNDSLGTTDTFEVTVSKFTTDVDDEYDILQGGSVEFEVREHNGRGTVVCESDGRDCSTRRSIRITEDDNTYTVRARSSTPAGKYSMSFTDEFGDDVAAVRNVDVYVYKMITPEHHYFFAEMTEGGVEFTGIDVDDEINAVVPGRAEITAVVTDGDADAVDLTEIADGKVTINKPGEYQVTYTDKMAGGTGDVVGTYTATFRVYALEAEADDGVVNLSANEVYGWTIDPSQTYGDVEVSIYRRNPAGEHNRRVYHSETRYEATGTDVENFTFDPAQYGEGIYTIRIENTSVGNHDLEPLVEEATFYAIEREYDFVMVPRGMDVVIESGSRWSVDWAGEYYSGELEIDGKTVTLDTSELPLGSTWVSLDHLFDIEGDLGWATLKWVTVVVYEVVPAEDSAELNPGEVTAATIEDLYRRTAEATAGLIRDLVAAGVPEDDVFCSMYGFDCYWAWGELAVTDMLMDEHLTLDDIAAAFNLTEEQAGRVNFELIQQAIDEFKTAFGGDEWDETGLRTAASLNLLSSDALGGRDVPLETDVEVTPLAEAAVDAGDKAEIEAALAEAGIDVDNIDYYDVSVYLKSSGMNVGQLHKLNDKITVALAKTSDPATGYTRQYFVVRKHGDAKPVVLTEGVDFYIENGVIYVISDEFSTYAVAYKDTLIPKAPDTGDEVAAESGAASVNLSTAVVIALAAVVLGGAVVFAKRK